MTTHAWFMPWTARWTPRKSLRRFSCVFGYAGWFAGFSENPTLLLKCFEKLGLGLDNCGRTTKNAYRPIYSVWCWLPSSCESSIGIPIEFAIVLQRARTKLNWEFASLYSVTSKDCILCGPLFWLRQGSAHCKQPCWLRICKTFAVRGIWGRGPA